MIKYIKMLSFVILMGAVSIGILIGADAITKDKIAKNGELTWKSAILTHHEVAYTDADFAEKFDASFVEDTKLAYDGSQDLTLYRNTETGAVSFRFKGNGLWDIIEGVISLESDFETILAITVTKQAETPGLGGVVAEKQYLDKYIGKKFDESIGIIITKNNTGKDNEVDAIVGATGTSNAFMGVLNTNYTLYKFTFTDSDALAPMKKAILTHNEIEFTNDNYLVKFNTEFTTRTKDDLTLYVAKSGNVSYQFTTEGLNGPITAVITLASDFQTIVKITVLSQAEGWGAAIQTDPTVLAAFEGKKFNPSIVIVTDPTQPNEVLDGFGGATTTKKKFAQGLNAAYITYYNAFSGETIEPEPEVDELAPVKQAILTNHGIEFTEENYQSLFDAEFTAESNNDLTIYKHTSGSISYAFETEGFKDAIKAVMTLESDFLTIKMVTVYEQGEARGSVIQSDPTILAKLVGKKFSTEIVLVPEESAKDNEVTLDGLANATTTRRLFIEGMNVAFHAHYNEFVKSAAIEKAILTNHGIAFTDENYKSLFDASFQRQEQDELTLYVHTSGTKSFYFVVEGLFSKIETVVTLASDFETISKISVIAQGEKWGATIQTNPDVLAAFEGKKFSPEISVVAEPVQPNEALDGFGGATTTKKRFVNGLNAAYAAYAEAFKGGN
ncbi:FMN-binding protein [Acholeplasma hippikon]|uniref:Na(+)-translocating NADH-quinone reductase subunit C n=1 Tax=Acholeplasma hippikon TaxID=264636 RepID=A0A449BHV1_9MOLU|nr:FMN-binding protein [Acholeplasma hippikon]VEU82025.1 Na(+)-translocating NADH-quinone reductase subunit C [Acholeplasma hippikon]